MAYLDEVLADSPYAFYRLDETAGTQAADASGNARHGTYVATPTLGAASGHPTQLGTAVAFNGTSQYATLAVDGFGGLLTSGYTVEFWLKTAATNVVAVFGVFNDGTTTAYRLRLNVNAAGVTTIGTHQVFTRGEDGASGEWAFTAALHDNAWHHVVIASVPTSSTIRHAWVDGTPATVSGTNVTGSIANFTYPLTLAANNSRGTIGTFAAATLNEVAFYPSVLSETRVQAHYTAALQVPVQGTAAAAAAMAGSVGLARPVGGLSIAAADVPAAGTGVARDSLATAAAAAATTAGEIVAARGVAGSSPAATAAAGHSIIGRSAAGTAVMAAAASGTLTIPRDWRDLTVEVGASRLGWEVAGSRRGWPVGSSRADRQP